jgi:hypothetical protein
MSFPITTANALRVTGLSQAISAFSGNGIFMGMYLKVTDSGGSDYLKAFQMYSDADGSAPEMSLNCYPNRYPWVHMRRAGGSTYDIIDTTNQGANGGWSLYWAKWNASTGDLTSGVGDVSGATSSGPTDWVSIGGTIKAIGVGLWRSTDGASDENVTQNCKIALPFIAKRLPTGAELTELTTGQGHPYAVFGSDLLDYWDINSKTSALNGWVLADTAGAITVDTGDNPTVDAPPGGGGSGSPNFFVYTMI